MRYYGKLANRFWHWILLLSTLSATLAVAKSPPVRGQTEPSSLCPTPVLSRLQTHTIESGETVESIANQYDLIPATLLGLNPELRAENIPVGTEILIPPYNGIRVEVPEGKHWRDLANQYNVRADVLFELNGCGTVPEVVFVPGVNWSPKIPDVPGAGTFNAQVFSQSPLPEKSEIGLKYGWRLQSSSGKVSFHSGIDLQAEVGTPVLAAGSGTVAYVGDRSSYGNLVAINHQKGKQTRYAHLKRVTVRPGETINAGDRVGTVGTTGDPDINQPHLHFEIRYNSDLGWVAEDPHSYLQAIVERKRESMGAAKHSIKKGSDRAKSNTSQAHRGD